MSARRGFALPAALLAILLIGALVASVLFGTNEETRVGVGTAERQRARLAAESAVELAAANIHAAMPDTLAIGESSERIMDGPGTPVVVHATRIAQSLFWVVGVADDPATGSGAASRIGLIVRVKTDSAGSITVDRIPERAWSELF